MREKILCELRIGALCRPISVYPESMSYHWGLILIVEQLSNGEREVHRVARSWAREKATRTRTRGKRALSGRM